MNTDSIQLSEDLIELVEKMAEHVHETWARRRKQERWVYGEKLDQDKMTHPDLRPYSDLDDNEKELDRRVVTETLKFLLYEGFKITK